MAESNNKNNLNVTKSSNVAKVAANGNQTKTTTLEVSASAKPTTSKSSRRRSRKANLSALDPHKECLLQQNWTCALDVIGKHFNKKDDEVNHLVERTGMADDFAFRSTSTLGIDRSMYTATGLGRSKKEAKEQASRLVIELAFADEEDRYPFVGLPTWVRSLLESGDIESNPGPPTGHFLYYCVGRALNISIGSGITTISEPRGYRANTLYRATFYYYATSTRTTSQTITWGSSAISNMVAGSIVCPDSVEVEVWTAGPFTTLTASSPLAAGTLYVNLYEYIQTTIPTKMVPTSPAPVTVSGVVSTTVTGNVSTTVSNNPLPVQVTNNVNANVTNSSLDVRNTSTTPLFVAALSTAPLNTTITNPQLLVNVSNVDPLDVNVVNTVDVDVKNVDPLAVNVTNSVVTSPFLQEPIWITEHGPQDPPPARRQLAEGNRQVPYNTRSKKRIDLLCECGDIESNPGPANLSFDAEALGINMEHEEFTFETPYEMGPSITPGVEKPPESKNSWTKEQLVDHILQKQKMKGKIGSYYTEICYLMDIECTNEYAILADSFEREPEEFTPIGSKPKGQSEDKDGKKIKKKPSENKEEKKDDKPIIPTKGCEQLLTPEARLEQLHAVCKRIAEKLKLNLASLGAWLQKPASTKFKILVLKYTFGDGWEMLENFHQYHLIAYAHLNLVPKKVTIMKLLTFDNCFNEFRALVKCDRGDMEAAKLHGKIMHALNGNGICSAMKDVDDSPSWTTMLKMKTLVGAPRFTGYEYQSRITNVVGDVNPNQSNLFYQDRLRGNFVTSENNTRRNAALTLPTTNLIPRNIARTTGPGVQDIVDDPYGVQVSEINVAEYYSNPIFASELSKLISDNVKNGQTSNWRRDNTSLAGFSSFDAASVNTTMIPKGLSLESMLLRIDLLHSVMAVRAPYTSIPRSSWGVINPSMSANPADIVEFGFNNSQIPGENCGGNNPVFPWFGGKGRVAFHLTLQSVPIERRSDAIFMPPGLLQATTDASEAIALFVLSWAEYPFGIYSYIKNMKQTMPGFPDANADIRFIPTQSLTRVPGLREIDIILPRRYAEANPTNQQSANAQAILQPTTGPVGTVALAANMMINVNFVGGGDNFVALTDYLYTWALKFDITTIKQYLGRLGVMIGVKDTLCAMHEVNIALCQQVPEMFLSDGVTPPAVVPYFEADIAEPRLDAMHQRCYVNHTRVSEPPALAGVAKFPIVGVTAADYRIFETNSTVWNKVILGLADAANIASEPLHTLPPFIGDPRCHFWERIEAMPMLTSWGMYYCVSGMTARGWDLGYTTSQNKWIQNRVRHTFCTTQKTGTIMPAQYAVICRKFMEQMYGRSPAIALSSVAEVSKEITHFERWLPGSSFAKVWLPGTAVGPPQSYDCFVPVLLPDIWVQYLADKLPRFACSFPPPAGVDSTQGYNENLAVHRNTNLNIVGPYLEKGLPATYPITEGPALSDEVKWNERLFFTNAEHLVGTYSGDPILEEIPNGRLLPCGRAIQLEGTEVYPTESLSQSTMCHASMSANGMRIVIYLNPAESVIYINACNRSTRLSLPSWLLNNTFAEPEIQALSKTLDIFDSFVDGEEDFAPSTAAKVVPATVMGVAEQAVDVKSLPSSTTPSTTIPQPAEAIVSPVLVSLS